MAPSNQCEEGPEVEPTLVPASIRATHAGFSSEVAPSDRPLYAELGVRPDEFAQIIFRKVFSSKYSLRRSM